MGDVNTWELAVIGGEAEIGSLSRFLAQVDDVSVRYDAGTPCPGEMTSGWEFLAVTCGSGGAVVAAIGAVRVWLESRRSVVTVVVRTPERTIELTAATIAEIEPLVVQVLQHA